MLSLLQVQNPAISWNEGTALALDIIVRAMLTVIYPEAEHDFEPVKFVTMKNILAIIDQAGSSKDFIRYAMKMTDDLDASLHVMHIQNPESYPLGTPGSLGTAVAELHENMKLIATQVSETLAATITELQKEFSKPVRVTHDAIIGNVSSKIEEMSKTGKADEVLLESRKDESFWLQPVKNMDVIRTVSVPVWVVPADAVYRPLREIVYATDYNEEDLSTMQKLVNETRQFEPHITALHVTDSVDFEEKTRSSGFRDMLKKYTGYNKLTVKSLRETKGDGLAHSIREYASAAKANLIVVLQENHNFLERIFRSGKSSDIIKESMVPVLIFHSSQNS